MKVRNKILLTFWLLYLISFMDRVNFSTALPTITDELKLSPFEAGLAMSVFHLGYGAFQIIGGMFADKFGGRATLTFSLAWWSLFTALTGMATKFWHFMIIRPLFGAGEAPLAPTCLKMISDWFPKREQVRASSLHMCAMAVGPALAPPIVVLIIDKLSWHWVFPIFALPGLLLALYVWKLLRRTPEEHPEVTPEELAEIRSDNPLEANPTPPGAARWEALKSPMLWKVTIMYLLHGIVFWGYVAWLPAYLTNVRKFELINMGLVASIPFFCGFLSMLVADRVCRCFFKDNIKLFIGSCFGIAAVAMYCSFNAPNEVACVIALSFTATFGLFLPQGAIWVIPMRTLPSKIMGFATGFINTGGQIGGFLAPMTLGYLIEKTDSYGPGFIAMAVCYVACALMILSVKMQPEH